MPKIPRQPNHLPLGIFLMDLFHHLPGAIVRAVVHQDDFVIGSPFAGGFVQTLVKHAQDFLFVVTGDHDRNSRAAIEVRGICRLLQRVRRRDNIGALMKSCPVALRARSFESNSIVYFRIEFEGA